METYVFIDKRRPSTNLIVVTTFDPNLELEKVIVNVEEGESIVDAVKEKLGI